MHRLINFIAPPVMAMDSTGAPVGTLDRATSVIHGLNRILLTISVGLLLAYLVIVLGAMLLAWLRARGRAGSGRHAAQPAGDDVIT